MLTSYFWYLGQRQTFGPGYGYSLFTSPSPLVLNEGESKFVQPQGSYYRVFWRRDGSPQLPSGVSQNGNGLQITSAKPEHSGTYYCELYGADGVPKSIPYEIRVQAGERPQSSGNKLIKNKDNCFIIIC